MSLNWTITEYIGDFLDINLHFSHPGEVVAYHATSITHQAGGDNSWYNGAEAATCLHFANEFREVNPTKKIVILCCYSAQVAVFKQLQNTMFAKDRTADRFTVLTTETVQGSEAEVVFLCPTVRGEYEKGPVGHKWLADIQRLTMCVSRTKNIFVLVGDLILLNRIPSYKRILEAAASSGKLICYPHIKKILDYDSR